MTNVTPQSIEEDGVFTVTRLAPSKDESGAVIMAPCGCGCSKSVSVSVDLRREDGSQESETSVLILRSKP